MFHIMVFVKIDINRITILFKSIFFDLILSLILMNK